jgi:hypothetical protein
LNAYVVCHARSARNVLAVMHRSNAYAMPWPIAGYSLEPGEMCDEMSMAFTPMNCGILNREP